MKYTQEELSNPAVYQQDPDLATLARRLADASYEREGRGQMGMGEYKRLFLSGQRAEQVYAALLEQEAAQQRSEAARKAARTRREKPLEQVAEAPTSLPTGEPGQFTLEVVKRGRLYWTVRLPGKGYQMRAAINTESQHWAEGQTVTFSGVKQQDHSRYGTQTTYIPVASKLVEAAAAQWARAKAEPVVREIERAAAEGWYPDLKADKVQQLAGDFFNDRLRAAQQLAGKVRAEQEARRAAEKAAERQRWADEKAARKPEPVQIRHLTAVETAYPLDEPVRCWGEVVVFTGNGRWVRISEDDPSLWGSHLLGFEGSRGFIQYGRPATPEEIADLEAREARAKALNRIRQEGLKGLEGLYREVRVGENMLPHQPTYDPRGPRAEAISWNNRSAIYGTEFYLILDVVDGQHWIYAVDRNHADGDDWSRNNTFLGITWRRSSSPEEHQQVRRWLAQHQKPEDFLGE
jgi:hypothetical protein